MVNKAVVIASCSFCVLLALVVGINAQSGNGRFCRNPPTDGSWESAPTCNGTRTLADGRHCCCLCNGKNKPGSPPPKGAGWYCEASSGPRQYCLGGSTTASPDGSSSSGGASDSTTGSSDSTTGSSDSTTGSSDSTTGSSDSTTGSSDSTTGSSDSTTGSSDSTTGSSDSTTESSTDSTTAPP